MGDLNFLGTQHFVVIGSEFWMSSSAFALSTFVRDSCLDIAKLAAARSTA